MLNSLNTAQINSQNALNNSRQNFNAQNRLQYTQPPMQGKEEIKNQIKEKAKDNMITQGTNEFEWWKHPFITAKNFALCMLMSIGFTAGTNKLMTSKTMAEGITNIQDFQATRMFRMGTWVDKNISGSFFGKAIGRTVNFVKSSAAKVPVPAFLREIGERIKIGSISAIDKQGMYTLGKGAEALNEAVEFLSRVPEAELKSLGLAAKDEAKLLQVLKNFRQGTIRGPVAYKKIASMFDNVSAAKLAKLSTGAPGRFGILDKWFNTTPNINLALHKAKFFNGKLNTMQGPAAKFVQKLQSLIGEASGGGVLGGKQALIMNAVGLMTGFNAASKAEKGDKLKAFMEDYIGFTLGSYLMSFFVGTWFNKAMGMSELGLDKAAVNRVGQKLGVDMTHNRLQDVVIAHNEAFKRSKGLESILNNLSKGKIDTNKAIVEAARLNIENISASTTKDELISLINKELKGKSLNDLAQISKEIKEALKSKLTIKSIFHETAFNKGNFWQRLGRYVTQKPAALIGRALSVGRYDLYANTNHFVRGLKFAKRFGGGFARAILVMFVLVEPFRKGFCKLSHLIFGKPKHSAIDDDEKKETNKKANSKQQQQEQIKQKLFAPSNPDGTNAIGLTEQEMAILKQKGASDNDILQVAMYKQEYLKQAKQMQDIQNTKPLASHSLLEKPISAASTRTNYPPSSAPRSYVPSSKTKIKPQQEVPIDLQKAIINADKSEEYANAVLRG